jgi:tetratricopeptide (TPR) repeat protein
LLRTRLLLLLSVTSTLTLHASTAHAQFEAFVQAVRELAGAAAKAEPVRSNDTRVAAHRMRTALAGWDRNIGALEARVARDTQGAPDERASQLHVELGVAYRVRGRMADAIREFSAALALRPASPDLQVLRALTLEAVGRPEEAGQAFSAAWKLDVRDPVKAYYVAVRRGPDRDRARALLTDTYRRLASGATGPAATPFVTLDAIADNLSRTPVVGDHATAPGFALLAADQYGDGAAALERTVRAGQEKPEDSPLARLSRGQRAEAENRVADARREYRAALSGTLVGRNALLVAIARLAQVEGDLPGAIDALSEAARLNPNDAAIHKELAGAYAAQGGSDDAFAELMAALLIDSRNAQAHAAIGQLYIDGGHDAGAVTAFTRALELMPDGYETRYALATALTRLGRTAEAAREFEAFERVRLEKLEERRREIAREVEREESIRKGVRDQDGGR